MLGLGKGYLKIFSLFIDICETEDQISRPALAKT
jgi:hypothetical protein